MRKSIAFFITLSAAAALLQPAGCNRSSDVEEVSVGDGGPIEQLGAPKIGPNDWPWWRGPDKNGNAGSQNVPTTWSEQENIIWKTDLPGRGHSSPTVVGDRIFLTTADENQQIQSVVCLDRETGKQLWVKEIHRGQFLTRMHGESSHASGTAACDGERLFTVFCNHDAVHVSALDLEGNLLWQKQIGSFDSVFGYAPSPAIYKSFVIVAAEHQSGGYLAALHRKTGDVVWLKQRRSVASYSSPIVASVAGRDQLLISGANHVTSYDPNNGEETWSVKGTAKLTCGTVTFSDDVVFASGGHPENETLAVQADGSGNVHWRHGDSSYVTSMLFKDGYLYAVHSEQGIAYCWNADDGREAWKQRLPGGKIRSSPVLAGENVFVTNARGTTYVIKADPSQYTLAAKNQLGDECYSMPAICGDQIYLRVADRSSGGRQETLYCIGLAGTQ